jgi:anti-sigma factor RsiW
MNCEEARVLLHALIDGELDAGHAREVEGHAAICPGCAADLRDYRQMHQALGASALRYEAPAALRRRLDAALPAPRERAPSRRTLLKGFALGSAFSGAVAASAFVVVVRMDQDQRLLSEVISAHLRSLQADHLTDVQSSDQHTVKPWFNGRLDIAPPVIDLTAEGFTLLGGRLDYIDGRAVATIVYRRRVHVINVFVTHSIGPEAATRIEKMQGFNVRRWTWSDLDFWAISDIAPDELQEFQEKFATALRTSGS